MFLSTLGLRAALSEHPETMVEAEESSDEDLNAEAAEEPKDVQLGAESILEQNLGLLLKTKIMAMESR